MDEHAINLTSEQGALAEDQQHPDAAPAADDTERASESDYDAAPTTPYALRLSDDLPRVTSPTTSRSSSPSSGVPPQRRALARTWLNGCSTCMWTPRSMMHRGYDKLLTGRL